jgi:chorismate dehydratase
MGKAEDAKAMKIGKFGFLNNFLPYYYLEKEGSYDVIEASPKDMSDMLTRGEIVYAPIPLYFYLKNRDSLRNYDFCVASRNKVLSVVVITKKREIDSSAIAVTNQSLTSLNLLRIILAEKGLDNKIKPLNSGSAWELLRDYDHALVIGDEAIKARMAFKVSMDLGEEWFELTNLPMVFGLSASLKDFNASRIDDDVLVSTKKGYENINEVVEVAKMKFNMPSEFLIEYFNSLSFKLGKREEKSIRVFEEYCKKYGLLR